MRLAFSRADPEQKPRRARVKAKEPHEASALLWFKECAFNEPKTVSTSKTAYHGSYLTWCKERNLPPLKVRAFGDVLIAQCGVIRETEKNRTKYRNLGLRQPHLRVVA